MEIEAALPGCTDPPPLAEQGGAAEQIAPQAQPVEAPAVRRRHDVPQFGASGKKAN
ncbi:hypothetical protein GCM10023158_14030 [Gluconacetobacter tumulicola]